MGWAGRRLLGPQGLMRHAMVVPLIPVLIDVINRSFRSSMGQVLIRFGSFSGQLCSGLIQVKFGFGSLSGQPYLDWVRVLFE